MRIGFLLFILGLSVTASAQMYRVGGTSRASFGSQQAEETAAPATRTFSSYGARRQRTQSANTQPSAPAAQTDSSAAGQAAPATTGNTAPQTPSSAKAGKADKNAGKNQKADPKEGEKKADSDQQAQTAVSQVQAMMNSFGLSAPQTGVPQAEGKNDKKAGSRGNNSRAGSANSNASSGRGGSSNKGADAGAAATPGVPDMSAIMQAASSGQMPDLSALMGGQSSGKK